MAVIEYKFEWFDVMCTHCGARYDTTEYEDEIPIFCNYCFTPSLRIMDRGLITE